MMDLLNERTSRGWVVRVVADGSDKSHYHIIEVINEPGSQEESLTPSGGGRPFKRNGATVWTYREEARRDKASRHWTTNKASW